MWIWEIIEGTLLLQMAGLSFAVIVDPYLDKRQRRLMINIIILVTSLIFQNRMECVAGQMQTFWSVWGYIVRPVVIVLYILIVMSSGDKTTELSGSAPEETPWYNLKRQWPLWTLVGVNTVVYLTALFSPIAISFDENGHFIRGPLGYTCHIVSFFLLIWLLIRNQQT